MMIRWESMRKHRAVIRNRGWVGAGPQDNGALVADTFVVDRRRLVCCSETKEAA
jgi:hypothetical protein